MFTNINNDKKNRKPIFDAAKIACFFVNHEYLIDLDIFFRKIKLIISRNFKPLASFEIIFILFDISLNFENF